MNRYLEGKNILITGVCGTVGTELLKQIAFNSEFTPKSIVGIDNNETRLFELERLYVNNMKAQFYLLDIRNVKDLIQKTSDIDIIFHCAALKHVTLCEKSPEQAILTNIIGIQNLVEACYFNNVKMMVFTSSDKAVNPTSVMGTSKLMGERLITAANVNRRSKKTLFYSTRFGNVLGSNGSVVPIFAEQIKEGNAITLTHNEMSRFVMSIDEAVKLIINSTEIAKGGEIFVTKMPVLKIKDLAIAMIEELAPKYGHSIESIDIEDIGMKPGEKLYEELISDEETRRTIELNDFYCILPAYRGMYEEVDYSSYEGLKSEVVNFAYNSSKVNPLSIKEIRQLLIKNYILENNEEKLNKRYWPGDKK